LITLYNPYLYYYQVRHAIYQYIRITNIAVHRANILTDIAAQNGIRIFYDVYSRVTAFVITIFLICLSGEKTENITAKNVITDEAIMSDRGMLHGIA
jgi:hypothetical protein